MANTAVTGHSVPHGKSLMEKIQDKADRAYRDCESSEQDEESDYDKGRYHGRFEGVCAALGILRGTSTKHEMDKSIERVSEVSGD